MIKKIFLIFLLSLFFLNLYLYAGETISLDALIKEAKENNPQIQAAKKKLEAAKAVIPQSFSLADPVLEFGYDKMIPRMTGMELPMRTYGLSQEIPFPTKLFLKRKIAVKERDMALQDYQEKENEIIQQLKSIYAQLFLIYRSIEINKENKVLLEQFSSSAARRFSVGQASQQDALKAQVELAKINNELIILEQERQINQAKLNIILNHSPDEELGTPKIEENSKKNFSLDKLYETALENKPELLAFKSAVEKERTALSLAKQEYFPDFMVRYEKQVIHGDEGPWRGMLGVSIPLWFWEKQNFAVKEMRANFEEAEAEYTNMQNLSLLEVKDAYTRAYSLSKLVQTYQTSFMPQAEQTLKASLIGYQAGKVDFLNLLDSQRMLLEIKLDYYRTLVNLETALADLERAVGVELR